MLTLEIMKRAWPHGDSKIPGLIEGIVTSTAFEDVGITAPLIVAHIMAQGSHECGAGTEVVENLNYRASALLHQWPSHFTPHQAVAMQHQPHLIADQAYNGRMGNRPGTDDGWNFRGRGFSQTTGREAYTKLGAATGLNLISQPDLINDSRYFLKCGVTDFIQCGCLPYAEHDNLFMVTQRLNGGQIGATQRASWLVLWKHLLNVTL